MKEISHPGNTRTRSTNSRRALSLCCARYYKHQNDPQSYISTCPLASHPVYSLFLSFPSYARTFPCRSPATTPFGQLWIFLTFSSRETASRQTIHKTAPFRTIRGSRFQAALVLFWPPLSSSPAPLRHPRRLQSSFSSSLTVKQARQLARAFNARF